MNGPITNSYGRVSHEVVFSGLSLIQSARVLVTDRMHPHVLAAMVGHPVILLPDRYGKNRAVFEYSSQQFQSVEWAESMEEAQALVRQMLD